MQRLDIRLLRPEMVSAMDITDFAEAKSRVILRAGMPFQEKNLQILEQRGYRSAYVTLPLCIAEPPPGILSRELREEAVRAVKKVYETFREKGSADGTPIRDLATRMVNEIVINRGFEGCLVLWPQNVWDETTARMNSLNLFVRDNRQFVRAFNNGATPLALDSQNRLLLPKQLLDYASIDREIVLFAYSDRIEVWNKKTYLELVSNEPSDFAQLAEKVMGNPKTTGAGDDVS